METHMEVHNFTQSLDTTQASVTMDYDWTALDLYYGRQLQLYLSPVFFILGTFGNVLAVVVLVRKRLRVTTIYNFMLVLAVADTTVLWISCFKTWLRKVSDFAFIHYSVAACRMVNFLFLSSSYLSSWIIVLMTVERFLVIWFPLRHKALWSTRNSRVMAAAVVMMAFAANIHVMWTFGHVWENDKLYCTYYKFGEYLKYLNLTFYCFIPFTIVIIMNTLMITRIRNRQMLSLPVNGEPLALDVVASGCSPSDPRERITFLLLTVSFTWLLLMLPYSLMGFVKFLHNTKIMRVLCFMLVYTNHSINFLLYCMTGKKFREELFTQCKCRGSSRRISKKPGKTFVCSNKENHIVEGTPIGDSV